MVGAQWHFDHLKHLHALEFQLKDCVCQCDFGCISLRMMLYVPPMSLRKSARKRQICWWARDIHKNIEHKEKPANPVISRVCEPSRCGAGGGGRTRTGYKPNGFWVRLVCQFQHTGIYYFKSSPDATSEKTEGHHGGTLKPNYIFSFEKALQKQGFQPRRYETAK